MSVLGNDFLLLPGMGTTRDTAESVVQWNAGRFMVWGTSDVIDGASTDAGNTPTTQLRAGLVMGKVTSTGKLKPYSPTATDGTQVAYGFLPFAIDMLDVFTQTGTDRALSVVIGGYIQAANAIGLDRQARQQLRGRCYFDDTLADSVWYPYRQQVSKTANYTVTAADTGTLFDNTGAAGAVTFTLPALADGLCYGFVVVADQNVTIASNEGTNIVTFNNASASNLAFSTPGSRIGGICKVWSNPGATKWISELPGANTVTIS